MARIKKDHGSVAVAQFDEFQLFELTALSDSEWKNFRLVRARGRGVRSRAWRLGWNGERFARNHDCAELSRLHPQILNAVRNAVAHTQEVANAS